MRLDKFIFSFETIKFIEYILIDINLYFLLFLLNNYYMSMQIFNVRDMQVLFINTKKNV